MLFPLQEMVFTSQEIMFPSKEMIFPLKECVPFKWNVSCKLNSVSFQNSWLAAFGNYIRLDDKPLLCFNKEVFSYFIPDTLYLYLQSLGLL